MKTSKILSAILILITLFISESCGPVIISSRPSHPTPAWFYPNRVVNVRYVYFPEYLIYYDLTLHNYIYLENGVWIKVAVLPPRFNTISFRHARQVRVNNYFDDNIRHYHSNIRVPVKSRRETTEPSNSRTGRSKTDARRSRRGD